MPILVARDLAKSFGAQDVFSGVTVQIESGEKIALVGANGEGKSTLLRILAGLENATAGQVVTARGLKVGYLPQQPPPPDGQTLYESMLAVFTDLRKQQGQLRELERAMSAGSLAEESIARYGELQQQFELAGGYTYELEIQRVLSGMGFDAEDHHKPLDVLSGGERTRALLAQLLLSQPDLLLLDEPTNHLDLSATEWLEGWLSAWKGSMVVVAHDRYFLDRVVSKVWDLACGTVEVYRGNYSRYAAQKAERLEQRRAEYEAQQAFVARTEAFIRRYKAGQRAKQARGRLKQLAHLERLDRPRDGRVMSFALESGNRSGDWVLRTRDLRIGFRGGAGASTCLFEVPDLGLRRLERVALIGPNGTGKTSFLRTIVGSMPPLSGSVKIGAGVKIGYFSQTREDLVLSHSPLDEILRVKDIPVSRARSFLSRFLFCGDEVFKPLECMSGGERSRVALARLTLKGANFLVLDEPTNHLDIASREVLEEVLLDFEGTVLFVSHDRYLVDALATQIWVIDGRELRVYEGGYADYLALREREKHAQSEDGGDAAKASQNMALQEEKRREARRRRQAERRQAERAAALEQAIADMENRLALLSKRLVVASEGQRLDEVRELGLEYSRLEAERERLLGEWVELSAEHEPSP